MVFFLRIAVIPIPSSIKATAQTTIIMAIARIPVTIHCSKKKLLVLTVGYQGMYNAAIFDFS